MRIGVDLGGSKIEAVLMDELGHIVSRQRVITPQGDYEKTVHAVFDLVANLEKGVTFSRPIPVGVGIPGSVSPHSGLIQNANSTCLIGRDLQADLSSRLSRSVRLANDADCFALSEAQDGSGLGQESVFGVILGTGVGAGIVVNGQLLAGPNAISGEWGHNPLPWPKQDEQPGFPCYCGRLGCIETFLSGPSLIRFYGNATGIHCSVPHIVALAQQGEPVAQQLMNHYEDRLARALAMVLNILDPHVVVLGGGLSNIERLYKNVPLIWKNHVFSDTVVTSLRRARWGDSSGVRGAAWLWPLNTNGCLGNGFL